MCGMYLNQGQSMSQNLVTFPLHLCMLRLEEPN